MYQGPTEVHWIGCLTEIIWTPRSQRMINVLNNVDFVHSSVHAKGGEAKKRLQYCMNPNASRHISYFRAIQGHSGGIAIDSQLRNNVLLPKGITTSGMSVKHIQ